MTLLNTIKEAARFGKNNTGSGVRQTWMNTHLAYDMTTGRLLTLSLVPYL